MKKIKVKNVIKSVSLLLALLMLISPLVSCTGIEGQGDELKILCTVAPIYDFAKNLTKDVKGVSVSLLCENGTDMHSYQPTVKDCADIASCDICFYIGGESDLWINELITGSGRNDGAYIDLSSAISERLVDVPHNESGEEMHDHADKCIKDEHIWLSLKNALALLPYMKDRIAEKDPENTEKYSRNCSLYCQEIEKLDSEFETFVSEAVNDTVIFADRFPFIYLTSDYEIKHIAAFAGCSAESEASFETIARLSGALENSRLTAVAVTESSDKRLAKTVIENSGKKAEIVTLDSMQSTTLEEFENGKDYLNIMRNNLEALKRLLGN